VFASLIKKMKIKLTVFWALLFVIITFGCHQPPPKFTQTRPYVISREDSLARVRSVKAGFPPLLPRFYGSYNVIVDSENQLYLHNRQPDMLACGTGLDPTKPPFSGLRPNDLMQSNEDDLAKVLTDSASLVKDRRFIVLAIASDTLNDKRLYPLLSWMTNPFGTFGFWRVRRLTEEEKVVLSFKKRNQGYSPEQVAWSSNFNTLWNVPKRKHRR
jgi:hypothetical protein